MEVMIDVLELPIMEFEVINGRFEVIQIMEVRWLYFLDMLSNPLQWRPGG